MSKPPPLPLRTRAPSIAADKQPFRPPGASRIPIPKKRDADDDADKDLIVFPTQFHPGASSDDGIPEVLVQGTYDGFLKDVTAIQTLCKEYERKLGHFQGYMERWLERIGYVDPPSGDNLWPYPVPYKPPLKYIYKYLGHLNQQCISIQKTMKNLVQGRRVFGEELTPGEYKTVEIAQEEVELKIKLYADIVEGYKKSLQDALFEAPIMHDRHYDMLGKARERIRVHAKEIARRRRVLEERRELVKAKEEAAAVALKKRLDGARRAELPAKTVVPRLPADRLQRARVGAEQQQGGPVLEARRLTEAKLPQLLRRDTQPRVGGGGGDTRSEARPIPGQQLPQNPLPQGAGPHAAAAGGIAGGRPPPLGRSLTQPTVPRLPRRTTPPREENPALGRRLTDPHQDTQPRLGTRGGPINPDLTIHRPAPPAPHAPNPPPPRKPGLAALPSDPTDDELLEWYMQQMEEEEESKKRHNDSRNPPRRYFGDSVDLTAVPVALEDDGAQRGSGPYNSDYDTRSHQSSTISSTF